MNELTIIPKDDWDLFGCLPQHVKNEFRLWARAVRELDDAAKPGEVALKWAARLGVQAQAVWNKRSLFRRDGWRALLNKRHAGKRFWGRATLPPEAVEYLKGLYGDNKRAARPAALAFLRQWKRWRNGATAAAIPGFDRCPPPGLSGEYPAGWSARNLMRYLPTKFELAAERRGLSFAVGQCGPQTFSTRAGLHYMSHVMIDDVWHDNFVAFERQGICRVLELDGLDVFSGALVFWGCKPRLKRADGTMDGALEKYVPLCLAGMFAREGYSHHGTTILAEHGTARVTDAARQLLSDCSGKRIAVQESGITGEQQAVIGWRGHGKGNSRFKAALESHHNLKHNVLASVPGQTGKARDHRPEFTDAMLNDDRLLLTAIAALAARDPERAKQLRHRLLDYHAEFVPMLLAAYEVINERDGHDLEGWDAIPGNIEILYRLAPTGDAPWLTPEQFAALPTAVQDNVLAAAAADKRFITRRRVSPADVQRRERGHLVQLPDWAIAELITSGGDEFTRELKSSGAYFNLFEDNEIAPEELRYESVVVTPDGARRQLPDDKYRVVVNPFDPRRLYVFDGREHFLGAAARAARINRFDAVALRAAYGHQKRRVKELTAPLIARHAGDIRRETARLQHNADVLAGAPENELQRFMAKADPVKDQLRRAAASAAANAPGVADEENYES